MDNFWSGARWEELLRLAIEREASDVHLSAGQAPFLRLEGRLQRQELEPVTDEFLSGLLSELLPAGRPEEIQAGREVDFAWSFGGRRFRVNAFRQQAGPALAMRLVPERIPARAELGAPPLLARLLTAQAGLILLTGPTGSGKTTTLASFVAERARQNPCHIITLEDPVEYLHGTESGSLINQRELGTDFSSFAAALRSALREDPDVLLVGELRDSETIRTALQAAETGHLVLATLHTRTAPEAVLRLESFFPAEEQAEIRAQLAAVLLAVVTQRLLPGAAGGRVCAAEVLAGVPAVRNLIRGGKVHQLPSVMTSGAAQGMQTMAQAVRRLIGERLVSAQAGAAFLEQG